MRGAGEGVNKMIRKHICIRAFPYYFSMCYDDLIDMLRKTGSGVILLSFNNKHIFLQIIVYADDIMLISRSPYGLSMTGDHLLIFRA